MIRETGPFRRYWNYFKRGKSEINFLLNIYQTIIIIWAGGTITGNTGSLIAFSICFGVFLFLVSLVIGKYSLTKVDTSMPYINPFTQDVSVYRRLMAQGQGANVAGDRETAMRCFKEAYVILERWINDG